MRAKVRGSTAVAIAGGVAVGLFMSYLTTPAGAQSGAAIYRDGRVIATTDAGLLNDREPKCTAIVATSDGTLYRLWSDGRVSIFDAGAVVESRAPRWAGWRELPQ